MTHVGTGVRRIWILVMAMALAVGALALLPTTTAEAAFPGGNGWIVFENSSNIYAMPSDGSAAPQLAESLSSALKDPVFSPDGTQVAVSRDVSGDANIWVADFNAPGGVPALSGWTKVSSGDADGEPTWAPDGTEIAFVRRVAFTITGTATANDPAGLTLTDATADFSWDGSAGSGVDANDLVTNTGDTPDSTSTVASATSTTITLAAPLSGGGLNTWTFGDTYEVDIAHRQLYKVTVAGGVETALSTGGATPPYDDNYPSWSPAGTDIAFATTRHGNAEIYTMDDTGGSLDRLTNFGNLATRPNWKPDGTKMVFNSPEGGGISNLWTMNADGSSQSQLTTDGTNDEHAIWSPDGTMIAFRRGGATTGKTFMVSAGGGAASQVHSAVTPASHDEGDWQPTVGGVADALAVDEGGSIAGNVLANDLALVIGTLTAANFTDPTYGTVTSAANGAVTYTHDGTENFSDSFTYQPTQNGVLGDVTTVTVTITPVDEAPIAVNDGPYGVITGGTLNVSAGEGVLANDTDPEALGLTATLVDDVDNGILTFNANGSFTYVHDGSAAVTDSFTYTAKDPADNVSNVATASIEIGSTPPTVEIVGPTTGAPGVAATFSTSITDGAGAPTHAWSLTAPGMAPVTGTDPTLVYTPTGGGVFTVAVTITDALGSDTDSATFTSIGDIGDDIFKLDIIWLASEGITRGCVPDGTEFCPTDNVTRGQMAAFLVRAMNLTDDGGGNTFVDDDGSIFEDDIAKLAAAGITLGCNPPTNDRFCPTDNVTRGQMAAFLVRAFGLTDDGGGNAFVDDDGSIFEDDIAKLAASGITLGCNPPTNDRFCPTDNVTRGQMAAFLHRGESYLP